MGFEVKLGSEFLGYIGPCSNLGPTSLLNNEEQEEYRFSYDAKTASVQVLCTLKEKAEISLHIWDLDKNLISILKENENYEKGNYSLNFDCGAIKPGVYQLAIKIGNKTKSEKIVVK